MKAAEGYLLLLISSYHPNIVDYAYHPPRSAIVGLLK